MPRVINLGMNSATTEDWLNASKEMKISAYDPFCKPVAPIADNHAGASSQLDFGWPIGDDSSEKNRVQTHIAVKAGF